MISALSTGILVIILVLAAGCDLWSRRIPNALTVTGLIVALVLRSFLGGSALLDGLLGMGLALLIVLPLFAMGGFGGGDAKLLIMGGAFLGFQNFGIALLATAVIGGGMSLAFAVRRGVILPALLNAKGLLQYIVTFGRQGERTTASSPGAVTIPYGVAIAVGSLVALYVGGGIS